MILKLPWRFHSVASLLNPIQSPYRFLVTLSRPSNVSSLKDKQSVRHSTNFLHLFNNCRKLEDLKPLKSLLVVNGLIKDEHLVEEFVKSCFHLGSPELALFTIKFIEKPSLSLQNYIIRCLCNHGLYEDVLCIYTKCWASGCPSDNYTFPFVIKACSALGATRMGNVIQGVVLRTGFMENAFVQTALVDFYAKIGCIRNARVLFDRILQPDLVSWNAIISGYSLNGLDEEAFAVFCKILAMGLKPNVSTLVSMIPVCTRMGCIGVCKSLHGFAVKSGSSLDEYLVPALISMYAGNGDLSIARKLFDSIQENNVTIWNAMISAYAQNKECDEVFEMFRRMLQANMQVNNVTFVSIVPSCDSIPCGECLQAFVIKNGLENQHSVSTAFLSMYAKLGDLNSAKVLFDTIPRRDLLSWNLMVSGYVRHGFWDRSLAAFHEMQLEGVKPDSISIISILSACSKLESILLGKSAHAFSLKMRFNSNLNVSNAILEFYSGCCQLSSSFKLFSRMVTRDVVSWNTLISGCSRIGATSNAVSLLCQMQQEGVKLDVITLVSVLPSCNNTENLVQGMTVHGYAIKMGFASEVSLSNALISMYSNCGALDAGKLLFKAMPERSVVSWNALLTGCRNHYLQSEAMVLFHQMIKEGQKPNYVTLLSLLPVCCTHLQGKSIHAYAVRTGPVLETHLLTSLIFMYVRFENINSCFSLFEIGENMDISLWNAIMSVHVQTKHAKKAVAFFCELLRTEMEPDSVTILSLISACAQLNSLNLTHSVMAYAIHKGFDKDVVINNALIDSYARCGNISISWKLFEGLLEKDVVSWSVMIKGYGLHGDGETALALLSQMKLSGLRPDAITYISILSACSHAGLVDQGRMVFNSMVEDGILPRMEHYACMVDLLGRTGHLNEAHAIVKNLPCKPSVSLLESLLGACSVHGNVELGETIGTLLLDMDPENPGIYVMIYNIYAAAGRWADANRVRTDMEGRRLTKVPGFSLVEENKHHVENAY